MAKGVELVPRHPRARTLRPDPCERQGFVGIDVAHARDGVLVKERSLDGTTARGDPRGPITVQVECIGSEARPTIHEFVAILEPRDSTESSRIHESKLPRSIESPGHVRVRFDRRGGRHDAEGTGHAQLHDDDGVIVSAERELLAATEDLADPGTKEKSFAAAGSTRHHVPSAHMHVDDGGTEERRTHLTSDGFDFWQFRHAKTCGKHRIRSIVSRPLRIPSGSPTDQTKGQPWTLPHRASPVRPCWSDQHP